MLVITSGDPYSVSVELLAPLLAGVRDAVRAPLAIIGSAWQWRDQAARLGLELPQLVSIGRLADARPGAVSFLDIGSAAEQQPAEALAPATRGALAVRALERLAQEGGAPGQRLAVVTAPIDKHDCHLAGYAFPGQTEFFEALWGARAVMTLAGPRLRVGLVTNHLPLRDVARCIDRALVERQLGLFVRTLTEAFGVARPRVAVVGVNPHAGDQGLFGDEESRYLVPAIAAVRAAAPTATISGPLPADTAFYRALHGDFDGVLAMYHDQGLGPLKTVHFDDAVNLSGGLPHLRVSPDHGPARDLFLRGKASPKSFAAALALAVRSLTGGAHG